MVASQRRLAASPTTTALRQRPAGSAVYTGQSLTVPGKYLAVGDRLLICTENKAGRLPKRELFTIAGFWTAADGTEYVNWRAADDKQVDRKRSQETGVTGPKVEAAKQNHALVGYHGGAWWWKGK